MKAGGLFTAIGLLAVLGGLIWYSSKHPTVDTKSTPPAGPKLVSVDAKQIDTIRILKSGSEPLELAKLADSWEIAKPTPMHADQDAVNMMTSTLATLNADRLIDEHPGNLSDFGLANPPLEVDFTVKGGKTQKLLIGSDTPANTGTYVKLDSDPKVYTIPVFTKAFFDKIPVDLRDKRLLTFNQDKLTSVTLAGKGPAVEFGKNAQGDWQITKPKPMRADTLLVDDLIRKLKGANMDISSTDAPEQFAKADKIGTASTTDNSGTQTIEVRKNKDNYYAKSSAVAGIYKIAGADLGDAFSKGLEDYRNKKLFDFGFNEVSRLEINGAAYLKAPDKWLSGSNQFDAGSLQAVIDKLRDISATKFLDKMAGTQTLTILVISGDNHRTEKVTFNKDGDSYDAQRDGEPTTVYVLDAKSFDDLQKAISGIKPYQAPKPAKKT
jgi:Domain of unknown function (DUF4340)